jgi:hypothetical protein
MSDLAALTPSPSPVEPAERSRFTQQAFPLALRHGPGTHDVGDG